MDAYHIDFLELLNGQVQYIVPRWQRRYRWGQPDIERLVEDLLTVAEAGPDATHYGGTLLTFPEPGPPGVVNRHRIIDGQQRLTTVSILLACIASEMGPQGCYGDWTSQIIRDFRLTNPGQPPEKFRKLRLQDGDEAEYQRGLDGEPDGPGAVTQAWKIARRLVAKHDAGRLLKGLERLRVVTIGLGNKEDPQQIFESLNATGRPLTESEKVKNWLLMGLPDTEQQHLHDEHWRDIERALGAEHASEPIDTFLRDFLRWRTGKVIGIDQAYEGLRRWAVQEGHAKDRPALCRELARLALLYGTLTGTAGNHSNKKIERKLLHLREMGIDVHRPLTLRLLDDASRNDGTGTTSEELAEVISGIGAWITRLWLADRPTAGMNRAVAEIAHGPGPSRDDDYTQSWLGRIRRLRNSRVGVPGDEEVREGIRTRKAYGASATRSSFAVLCALMEAEHKEEAPARDRLTIEHVMPQKLTNEWRRYLGDGAEEIHGRYRDRLANLTLSGDATNSSMGTTTFNAKREMYKRSAIGITRRLAQENTWDEEVLERRAEELTVRALNCWPWQDQGTDERDMQARDTGLRWRIEEGPWRTESFASEMVLNIAATLLSRDPANAERLFGEAVTYDLQSAARYPAGSMVGTRTLRAVPDHSEYVLYPYGRDYQASAERCQEMGKRCGVSIDVEFDDNYHFQRFWRFLKSHTGGVSGQKDNWRGGNQWADALNSTGDSIGIYVGNPEMLWLYIKAGKTRGESAEERVKRVQGYSWTIRAEMSDQELEGNLEKNSAKGNSINVQRRWVRDDENEWPEAAQWIKEQHDRLKAILAG